MSWHPLPPRKPVYGSVAGSLSMPKYGSKSRVGSLTTDADAGSSSGTSTIEIWSSCMFSPATVEPQVLPNALVPNVDGVLE